MAEKMTEAEIDQLLVRAGRLEKVFYTGTGEEEMNRAIQRDDLQGRLLLFHAVRALRQVREEREGRERYWDGVRRLMVEAGAEPGDAEHLVRSLIDQRDEAREQVRRLRGALPDPDKLEILISWFDARDKVNHTTGHGVQDDLQKWAQAARAALATSEEQEATK